jgi:hypothetical protein
MTAHRDYSHRDVLDKLGIMAGQILAIDEAAGDLDADLRARIGARVGRTLLDERDQVDLVLLVADDTTDITAHLRTWRERLIPSGGIWVLTPKRGLPGYLNHEQLIPLGLAAGLVDNKICSVSDTTSAMRFVIRRSDRPR